LLGLLSADLHEFQLLLVDAVDRIIRVNIDAMIPETQFAVLALMDMIWTQMNEDV